MAPTPARDLPDDDLNALRTSLAGQRQTILYRQVEVEQVALARFVRAQQPSAVVLKFVIEATQDNRWRIWDVDVTDKAGEPLTVTQELLDRLNALPVEVAGALRRVFGHGSRGSHINMVLDQWA